MNRELDRTALDLALRSLAIRLDENRAEPVEVVVCGGSALILTGKIFRTTRDVDIVALIRAGQLASPAPLPDELLRASKEVAEDLGLDNHWLNNGPSRGEGGLFQMGLPAGLVDRLTSVTYGERLTVHFIDRLDHIHFKLYAAVDRGGYHVEDLRALEPTPAEIEAAARWCMTHDVSDGFRMVLKRLLMELGYEDIADRL
jgi:hypothetical protein